jgi:hypothetical protein
MAHLGCQFCDALEQLGLSGVGSLYSTISTPPQPAALNAFRFKLAHVGGNAGGNVVVRRMKGVR